ncbi:MAG: ABC transporter permease [bacterium]|jgi:ABC-type uncharacterized transport system permease subunit
MKWHRITQLFATLAVSLGLVSVCLWVSGYSPPEVLRVLVESTWQSTGGTLLVFNKATLLILAGLAVVIPYRAGLFNIGGEGQMITGGFTAAVIGTLPLQSLGPFHAMLALGLGTLCGALWGLIAALLKTWRGIHEVISTIMLNFIALNFVNQLTFGTFNAGAGSSRTNFIHSSAKLPLLAQAGSTELSLGILLAVLLAVIFSLYLSRTWDGFRIRAVGINPTASTYSGISAQRAYWLSMLLGGGCAGLAGAVQTLGMEYTFYARFVGGSGFDGIAVAFLALAEPWATVPASLFLATLRGSDRVLQLDLALPREFVFILEGILIICIAVFMRKRPEEKNI